MRGAQSLERTELVLAVCHLWICKSALTMKTGQLHHATGIQSHCVEFGEDDIVGDTFDRRNKLRHLAWIHSISSFWPRPLSLKRCSWLHSACFHWERGEHHRNLYWVFKTFELRAVRPCSLFPRHQVLAVAHYVKKNSHSWLLLSSMCGCALCYWVQQSWALITYWYCRVDDI